MSTTIDHSLGGFPTALDALTHAIETHRSRERISEFACVALPLNCHQHTESDHSNAGTGHQPTDARYRILEDTHCLRHLTDSDRATLKQEFVETGDLELLSEGTTFISLRNPHPDPTADADIARRLLRTLYDVELSNVGRIEEVVHATDRTVFWPS
jgi:hypothetical protein